MLTDWNQLASAVPETVINLIVGRCFCYHEIDHLIYLSYVPGTINAFNRFSKKLVPVSDSPLLTNAVIVIVIVIITRQLLAGMRHIMIWIKKLITN